MISIALLLGLAGVVRSYLLSQDRFLPIAVADRTDPVSCPIPAGLVTPSDSAFLAVEFLEILDMHPDFRPALEVVLARPTTDDHEVSL